MASPLHDTMRMLKGRIAALEPQTHASGKALALGIASLDATLGGGLMRGALHEVASSHKGGATATGFVLALASLAAGRFPASRNFKQDVLWIQHEFAALEYGGLYGPGVVLHGRPSQTSAPDKNWAHNLIVLRVRHMRDVLWAMEEGLKCPGVALTIADILDDSVAADATALRRLSLAASDNGTLGLLLRAKPSSLGSTAATRWEVGSAPGIRDRHGGMGFPVFALTLVKNRRGPPGHWLVTWDHHERAFRLALSLALAAKPDDGPRRAVVQAS